MVRGEETRIFLFIAFGVEKFFNGIAEDFQGYFKIFTLSRRGFHKNFSLLSFSPTLCQKMKSFGKTV